MAPIRLPRKTVGGGGLAAAGLPRRQRSGRIVRPTQETVAHARP
jgi:hypothetical protein